VDIQAFLEQDQLKDTLRFSTAGSVDDGKSTLIGRLLYDARAVYEDQLDAVRQSRVNRASGPIDFSLLTDGLRAEREQGITIDVAYRYFATARRKFIIADTPGHAQYTRNMATGASTADLAIILIDARQGVLAQSRRHAYIAALLGIPHLVVAVNKMDLVDFSQDIYSRIQEEFSAHLAKLGAPEALFIPISALDGDNVIQPSARTPWYSGPSLLEHLENVKLDEEPGDAPLRLPVQYVVRPDAAFRGYAGQIASGTLRPGDAVVALPSGRTSRVKALVSWDGELREAFAPMSVTVQLEDELDISRGDMLVRAGALPHVARRFEASLVWMHQQPLAPGRAYLLKHTTQQVHATVTAPLKRVGIETLAHEPASKLELNEIGHVTIETVRPLFFDAYRDRRTTGAFVLIDPLSNATVAAGMIEAPLHGTSDGPVTTAERRARAGHAPAIIRLSRRAELALQLERALFARGCLVYARATAEEARVLNAAGLIAIVNINANVAHSIDGAPVDLAAADPQAVTQILAALEERDVLPGGRFQSGEGI